MRAAAADTGVPGDLARAVRGRGLRRYLQIVPIAVVLWALDALDRFRGGAQAAGLRHAPVIVTISRHLGEGVTLVMNHWLVAHPLAAAAAAGYYILLHGLVTGIAGILLLRSRHPAFRLHRNALLAASAIGLIVFWAYPVAPPRMLPGFHDTTAAAVPFFSHILETRAADQFGSLPSLHVTWALWVAAVARALVSHRALRAACWAYPALTVLDVIATANHYLLDVITAPAVLVLAYAIAGLPALGRRQWHLSMPHLPMPRRALPPKVPPPVTPSGDALPSAPHIACRVTATFRSAPEAPCATR